MQSFSGFVALNRADLTHEARVQGIRWGRLALIAIVSVLSGVLVHVLAAW